jgi:ATP-binding cassette, subfamily B, bacterial MsbA
MKTYGSSVGIFTWLLSLTRPYVGRLTSAIALIVAGTVASLAVPATIGRLVDGAHRSDSLGDIGFLACLLMIFYVMRIGLAFAGGYLLGYVGENVVCALRARLFEHIHSIGLADLHAQRLGELSSRLSADAIVVRDTLTETASAIINEFFVLAGSIAVMVVMNSRLAIVVLLIAPCAAGVSKWFGPRLERLGRQVQDRSAASLAIAQESIAGAALVKSLSRERFEIERYHRSLRELLSAGMANVCTSVSFRAASALVSSLMIVAIFWMGGIEARAGKITSGGLVTFLFYSQNVGMSFSAFASLYGRIRVAGGATARIFEMLISSDTRGNEEKSKGPLGPIDGSIEFRSVDFSHRDRRPILSNFNMTVASGEVAWLKGKSGAGKSTILSLIMGLYDPSNGEIFVGGHPITTTERGWLRRHVALVPQDPFLFAGTVADNIRYGRLDATDSEIEYAAQLASAHEFIEALPDGYATAVGERGVSLSGGQRQRITLARSLLRGAKIVLLDEVTSASDPETERSIMEAVVRVNQTLGSTFIIVTHRTSADRSNGRVIEIVSTSEFTDQQPETA